MHKKVFFLACFFIYINCLAQQYPTVHYTPKDGLVNSRVRKAYQDSKGRMYFLTYAGLSVYDGARFRNYTTQNGLASDLVNDIIEVGDDSLLVATNTDFLNTLVGGKMSLLKIENDSCPLINQFYRHNKNEIYISSDNGLYVLEGNRIRRLNFLSPARESFAQYLGSITGVGNYLIVTTNELRNHKGLYLYDIKNDRICDALPDNQIIFLGKDENNRVWLSSPDKLYQLDSNSLARNKLVLTAPVGTYEEVKDFPGFNMTFDKNYLWLVYKNKEIVRIEKNGSLFRMRVPEPVAAGGVRNIFIDKENTIWLCNDGAGVFKITNSPLKIFETPAMKPIKGYVHKAFCFRDVTWYSTTTNKLFRRSQDGLVEFNCNMSPSPAIFHEMNGKLLATDYENIYEAAFTNTGEQINFHKTISLPDPDYFGFALFVDHYGNLITSRQSGIGVWKNNKLVFHLPVINSDRIEGLSLDRNNLLWVVKRYTETVAYSLHPENISNYLQPVFRFEKNTAKGSPRSFVIDKTGLLWIGTRDDGLFAYKLEENQMKRLYHFHTGNGLMDNFVNALACDSMNNIIVGTQTGLDRILRNADNSCRVENLSKSSNFFAYIKEVWADAGKNAYGLTSTGSMLQLSPSLLEKNNYTPQLVIEEVRVNAQSVLQEQNIFTYKQNNINFLIAAPSFIDEKQVSFSYLLVGSGNNQWSDTASANAVINLTNLSAGKYSLKVRAFFPSTPYSPAELSYSFEITPPWWQTLLFRLLVASLIMGLLIIGFRFYYNNKLRRQKTILEKQQAIEKERTRIATDMHDDLGAGLSRIKFLSETIGIKKLKQEPIEDDITSIRQYAHEMIDKMGEIVWALNEKNDSLSDLLAYTRSYAVEYLSQNGIHCTVETPDEFPSAFVSGEFRRNIYLAVKEALHNIVKHAEANTAFLRFSVRNGLHITIRDDGRGFTTNNIKPYSNGLINMKKRMSDLGGSFELENSAGTTIKLSAPLPL